MNNELIFETKEQVFQEEIEAKIAYTSNIMDEKLKDALDSIPQKMAFKIGEVAKLAGVKPYVLRYWETEFKAIRPQKSRQGQRVYTRKDVETIFVIQKLLYKDRYSIEGARTALKKFRRDDRVVKKVMSDPEEAPKGIRIQMQLTEMLEQIQKFKSELV